MKIKFRIWTKKETLARVNGKAIGSPEELMHWLKSQPDGRIEYFAGRWWCAGKEAVPFLVRDGKTHCAHPIYRSKKDLDTRDFPEFFAFEVWKKAESASKFCSGISAMTSDMVEAIDKKNN